MSQDFRAYTAPFLLFMLLLGLTSLVPWLFAGHPSRLVTAPHYWVYPLQTLACGGLLAWYWRRYEFGRVARWGFTVTVAVIVFVIWIAPQELLQMPARRTGFDPTIFQGHPALFLGTLGLRFLRLVVVVPLLEEIFWRGFLLREIVREDFTRVPFGTYSHASFAVVTALFGLAHWGPDFWPAIATGALYNLVAYRTRRLSSCVLAHAITNLLLGLYIMRTQQWGFW